MRVKEVNGVVVPYNKSSEELEIILSNGNMSDFTVACEALSYKTDIKAFELLKKYATNKDKFKRLIILKTIFRHPNSIILKDFLVESILSDDILFAENGLKAAFEYDIEISDNIILISVFKHFENLYCNSLYILKKVAKNEENFLKIVELFNKSDVSGQKEVLCETLCERYLPEKAEILFELFAKDKFSKIRLIAVKIGKKYNFDISRFYTDLDGHVKNALRI